ncbi:hypothetical protein HDU83_009529 [Entophlyctis luteolus]|nr:hypothetical protein HDU82_005860 [Entophlyctis luteolus]KAJ3350596.1 hypothetical protein HDU83_009529 [Entophlyctis luteolus]KAJ3389910.1 hypothetical protein HDU84_008156 [Entophlyctis sp. JEL0112]
MSMQASAVLHPIAGYPFGVKEAQMDEENSVSARQARLQADYALTGMRRTVEGVLLVHEHGHPHVLMLQVANAFFKLPGDVLKPGEDEIAGLQRALTEKLAPTTTTAANAAGDASNATTDFVDTAPQWEAIELLGTWYRPTFDQFMASSTIRILHLHLTY